MPNGMRNHVNRAPVYKNKSPNSPEWVGVEVPLSVCGREVVKRDTCSTPMESIHNWVTANHRTRTEDISQQPRASQSIKSYFIINRIILIFLLLLQNIFLRSDSHAASNLFQNNFHARVRTSLFFAHTIFFTSRLCQRWAESNEF